MMNPAQENQPKLPRIVRVLLLRGIEGLEWVILKVREAPKVREVYEALRFGRLGIIGWLGFGVGVLVVGVVGWWASPKMEWVRPANVGAGSLSVGWVGDRVGLGCVILNSQFSIFNSKIACDWSFRKAHLVHFTALTPETTYQIYGLSGLRLARREMSTVTTIVATKYEELPEPLPAYGSVIDAAGEKVPGALVYVYTLTNLPQYPLAVQVNAEGNYAVNLGNLEHDGKSYVLQAFESAQGMAQTETDIRFSAPFPPMVVKEGLEFEPLTLVGSGQE